MVRPERVVPHSLEAEIAVLGGLLVDRDAMLAVLPLLREADFYAERHRILFATALELYEAASPIDPVTLGAALRRAGKLEAVGGYEYIASLLDAVPTAANIAYHAGIVRDKARLRRVLAGADAVMSAVYEGEGLAAIAQRVDAMAQDLVVAATADFQPVKETIWPAMRRLEELQRAHAAGGLLGIPTGFARVDAMLCGLQAGDLIVVAARPAVGKTAWALNAVAHAAGCGVPCAVVSLEMTSAQLTLRLLAGMARVDMQRLRRGCLEPEETERMARAAARLHLLPIWLDDYAVTRAGELRAKLTRLARREGIRCVVIDYLQLIEGSGEENRRLEIGAITRTLKLTAKDLDVPIVLLSQLSRAPEARANHRPMLSDLRESGDIEQDADVVLLLYRPELYIQDGDTKLAQERADTLRKQLDGVAELIVAKQRNGPTGAVPLYFRKAYTLFEDVTTDPATIREAQEWVG